MRARIAQCLCPDRHCIAAVVAHPRTEDPADSEYQDNDALIAGLQETILTMFQGYLPKGLLGEQVEAGAYVRRYCEICGADALTWRFEVAYTQDRPDWDSILKESQGLQRAQQQTAKLLREAGVSYQGKLEAAQKASEN